MVTIGMNYYVIPGKESVFEAAVANVVRTMQSVEGHAESHLYKEINDEDPAYLIVSRWENEDAFRAFIGSDAFKKVTNWGKENILSRRPSHTTYQEG
jgi:heme-degrading monooxygenase HmoA